MKFVDKLVEVTGPGLFMPLERQQLLQARRPLLQDAAIRAFLDVTAQLPRLVFRQSSLGEIVEDALYLLAIHNQINSLTNIH